MPSVMVQRLGEVAADLDAGEQRRSERLNVEVAGEIPAVTADEAPLGGQDPLTTGAHVAGDPAVRGADESLGGSLVEPVVRHQSLSPSQSSQSSPIPQGHMQWQVLCFAHGSALQGKLPATIASG